MPRGWHAPQWPPAAAANGEAPIPLAEWEELNLQRRRARPALGPEDSVGVVDLAGAVHEGGAPRSAVRHRGEPKVGEALANVVQLPVRLLPQRAELAVHVFAPRDAPTTASCKEGGKSEYRDEAHA